MCKKVCCMTTDTGVTEHRGVETASTSQVHVHDWGLVRAACMMDHSSTQGMDWNSDDAFEGHSPIEAAAGSVTLRGLLYSLMHPAPRRFLSLKSPALFTINKAALLNRAELQCMCWVSNRSVGSTCGTIISICTLVYLGRDILSSLCVDRLRAAPFCLKECC